MTGALPEWEDGTVAVLTTAGAEAHAIPVSTCVRAGPHTILLALALRRTSLARLRDEPSVAVTVLAGHDVACTAHGRATVVREPMRASGAVAAVRVDVDDVQDHGQPTFVIEAGVAWRWTDDEAAARDRAIRAELKEIASGAA